MEPTVLYIDMSFSSCGACGKGCIPSEPAHNTITGYSGHGEPGCGKVFTHVSSHYAGDGIKTAATQMRPDLPWHLRPSEQS
jgi:hypothetical protein